MPRLGRKASYTLTDLQGKKWRSANGVLYQVGGPGFKARKPNANPSTVTADPYCVKCWQDIGQPHRPTCSEA